MLIKLLKIPLFVIIFIAILCNSSLANQDLIASITPDINKAFEGQVIEFTASAEGSEGELSYEWSEQNGVGGTLSKKTYTMPSISESPYEISCTVTDDIGSDTATENITICKVESITPNYGEEVDDGDNNDKTKVYVYQVGNSDVNISVTLSPALNENELPAGWTIECGNGEGKLMRTVSGYPPSKTEFTFSFNGTDSGYKTTLYVYDAILGLYADEGNVNSDKYGHSWWNLTVDNNIKTFIQGVQPYFKNKYFGSGGWWPTNAVTLYGPGAVYFGSGAAGDHTATGQKEWNIEYYELTYALSFIINLDNATKDWSVTWDNCTDEAIWTGNSAEIETINAGPPWTSPETLSDWLNSH